MEWRKFCSSNCIWARLASTLCFIEDNNIWDGIWVSSTNAEKVKDQFLIWGNDTVLKRKTPKWERSGLGDGGHHEDDDDNNQLNDQEDMDAILNDDDSDDNNENEQSGFGARLPITE